MASVAMMANPALAMTYVAIAVIVFMALLSAGRESTFSLDVSIGLRYFVAMPDHRRTWLTWTPRGRDAFTNPRSTVAHHGDPSGGPLACGRWLPEDMDAIVRTNTSARRCKRCQRALR